MYPLKINTQVFCTTLNPFDSRSVRFTMHQICRLEHTLEAFSMKNYFRPRRRPVASSI